MDENHSEAKDILRKRILEEKRSLVQPVNPDSSEIESGSVLQSHTNNTLNDNTSLFHSDEDTLPGFEAKEPGVNSVFSSENTSLTPQSLFQSNQSRQEDESSVLDEFSEPVDSSVLDEFSEPDDSADNAFPLFLSFKANDSMQTVSEGVREKYSDRTDSSIDEHGEIENSSTDDSISSPYSESPVSSENHEELPDMNYADIGIPIFKPFDSAYEQSLEPTYDIPKVFSNSDTISEPASSKAGSSQQASSPTVRPGASYTAAQQMGNIVPLGQREFKAKRSRTQSHKPLLILLLSITILIAVFSFWSNLQFDSAFSKFFGSSSVTKSPTQTTSLPSVTAAATTEPKETAAETSRETTAAVTKPKPTATPAPTKETTAAETTAAETTTASSSANTTSAMTPSGFSTSIADGKSSGDTATFNILFKNTGSSDVSLFDGVEFITIAFTTSSIKITEVTSPDFTFTADPDKTNYFIGTPVSTDVIDRTEKQTVAITAKSSGSDIGKYSVKYYVKCYS